MDVLYAIADILVPAVSKCLIIMRQSTGLTAAQCEAEGISYDIAYVDSTG